MKTIIAAFCGCGKSYLCDGEDIVELECWKYDSDPRFPMNIIEDIASSENHIHQHESRSAERAL